jgi:hypothetical protein
MKSFGRLVHETDDLCHVIPDGCVALNEHGLGKASAKVQLQLDAVAAEQNHADTVDAAGDEHLAQGAFASRVEDGFDDGVDMRCRVPKSRRTLGNHEVHGFLAPRSFVTTEDIQRLARPNSGPCFQIQKNSIP